MKNKVNIPTENCTCKFVVMDNYMGGYSLYATKYAAYHRDVIRSIPYLDNTGGCLGGGRINITDGKITAYGYSVDFGTPNQEIVESLLKEYIADKPIELVVEMGVGY